MVGVALVDDSVVDNRAHRQVNFVQPGRVLFHSEGVLLCVHLKKGRESCVFTLRVRCRRFEPELFGVFSLHLASRILSISTLLLYPELWLISLI